MAHVGRFYKLLHRRDICLGCKNYRFAFPEAWVAAWDILGGTRRWTRQGLILRPIDPPQTHRPRWESEQIVDNGVPYKCIAEFDGYTPLLQLTHVIVRWHTGSAYHINFLPVQPGVGNCSSYFYSTFGSGTAEVLNPDVIGGLSVTGSLSIAAARWNIYPP